jgi:hypothetical protein
MERRCVEITPAGRQCRARPLRDGDRCFVHDPEHREAAAEARHVGGLRRRREGAVQIAFDFEGLETGDGLRRLLEVAALDVLALENSIARVRAITYIVATGIRLLEAVDLEARIVALEGARGGGGGNPSA